MAHGVKLSDNLTSTDQNHIYIDKNACDLKVCSEYLMNKYESEWLELAQCKAKL
jgi:hypothetical protein